LKHAVPTFLVGLSTAAGFAAGHPQGWPSFGGGAPVPRASEPEVVTVNAKDALGQRGEQLAVEYLQRAGFRILSRNWRCSEGEIDIVMADRRALVAVEVKTRSGTAYGTPLEAVTRKKRNRLRRLAVRWVIAHGVLFDEVRVDVVEVLKDEQGGFTVEHIRGVG
jgi:putative endonuclease